MSLLRYERWAHSNLDIVLDSASNGEWYARCPFKSNHKEGDRNPSFGINVRKGVYYCHGCQERGNFAKLAKLLNVRLRDDPPSVDDLDEAIDALLDGVEEDHVRKWPESWLDQFTRHEDEVYGYWQSKRGLSDDTITAWKLGYDPLRDAATIPIRDFHGNPLGVIRRRMDPNAKPRYIYPKGFKISEHLWGSHACKGEHTVAVTEGSVDALAMWDVGVPTVALLGSRISDHQTHLMHKLGCSELVVLTDRDKAGRLAAQRVSDAMSGVIVSIGRYQRSWPGKDPADLTQKQRVHMYEHAA